MLTNHEEEADWPDEPKKNSWEDYDSEHELLDEEDETMSKAEIVEIVVTDHATKLGTYESAAAALVTATALVQKAEQDLSSCRAQLERQREAFLKAEKELAALFFLLTKAALHAPAEAAEAQPWAEGKTIDPINRGG